ncbi:MAG: TetR/AcrR family transcriptional regulator [Clostridiales bacterium]|nr:TetR/AcrR family transcriptional regulator [Clostridiales bacterium]
MDRRVKRTKTAVFNAVMELIVEKGTDKITVLELCKRADINKSTFYLHYSSMEDCLEQCFQSIMNGIVELSKQIKFEDIKRNPRPVIERLLDEAEKQIDYLIKFKDSNICGPSIKILKDTIVKTIAQNNGFNPDDNYYEIALISFAVAGCVDAVIVPLPYFNKEELTNAIVAMLQSKSRPVV